MKRYKSPSGQNTLPLVNSLYTNYKTEVYVSGLIERGVPIDRIRILRKGKSHRGHAKEVDRASWEHTQDGLEEHLCIYVHKRDLYDSLPEGLFHSLSISERKKGKTGIVNMIRKAREEEFHARFFFKPFEMAIDRMLVSAQLYEQCLEKRDMHREFICLLDNDWKILRNMPLDKALFILNFLPQSYRVVETRQIAQILSVFLDCSVCVEQEQKIMTFKDENRWHLGDGRLGLSTFMGGTLTDSFSVFNVRVEGLLRRHCGLIHEDNPARIQLHRILDLFLPADAEVCLTFKIAKQEGNFTLSDHSNEVPLLGFTTLLS
ncbi:type VI secretion system baseplate subunit TssG [Bacteroides heparinolyticus]|uniref:type VI secretion system baseplate subunit TssG n=1 Tax=Prevotella heparinolytica TaxID=28113 RepID=UPI00359F1A3D